MGQALANPRKTRGLEKVFDEFKIWWDGAALVAQRPRVGSWRPGIESHVGLPAWSLLLPLPVPPTCVLSFSLPLK